MRKNGYLGGCEELRDIYVASLRAVGMVKGYFCYELRVVTVISLIKRTRATRNKSN